MSGEQINYRCLCGLPEDPGTMAEVLSGILICMWGHFFPLQRARGCARKQPPLRGDARRGFCSLPDGHRESADSPISAPASGSAVFPCPSSCLPAPLAPGKGREEEKGHKGHLQGTTRQPWERASAWAELSFPSHAGAVAGHSLPLTVTVHVFCCPASR